MKYSCLTDKGKVREQNEDYVFASDQKTGPLGNLFIIADGMGGENAGDYASALAVNTVVKNIRENITENINDDWVLSLLKSAVIEANWRVFEQAQKDPQKKGMGTTLVAAAFFNEHLYIANVGDSRLYVREHDFLRQVTLDHSYVQEMVRRGEMSQEEARNHKYRNRITRAIGVESIVRPDFFSLDIHDVQEVLMCTDGLTNMLTDDRIEQILCKPATVLDKSTELVNEALDNGGLDNVSVILIDPHNS